MLYKTTSLGIGGHSLVYLHNSLVILYVLYTSTVNTEKRMHMHVATNKNVLEKRLVRTSFKIAVRTGFETGLVKQAKHCYLYYVYYGCNGYNDY